MHEEQERAAFECHIQATEERNPMLWSTVHSNSVGRDPFPPHLEGRYFLRDDQKAWVSWQARASLAKPHQPVGGALTDEVIDATITAHGTGGWQTPADMRKFARAIEAATLSAPVAQPGGIDWEAEYHGAEAVLTEIRTAMNGSGLWKLGDELVSSIRALIAVAQPGEAVRCHECGNVSADCICAAETHHATPIAAQPAVCPFCGGDKGHWEGCRAPNIPAAQPAAAEPMRKHVEDFATAAGWKREDGEGAFEFVQRTSYHQGWQDGRREGMGDVHRDTPEVAAPAQAAAVPEAAFYVSDHDVEMLKDKMIAGRGCFLSKYPREGFTAYARLAGGQGDVSGEGEGA
jgi:hypothetical protein